jgi:hypothetical protein
MNVTKTRGCGMSGPEKSIVITVSSPAKSPWPIDTIMKLAVEKFALPSALSCPRQYKLWASISSTSANKNVANERKKPASARRRKKWRNKKGRMRMRIKRRRNVHTVRLIGPHAISVLLVPKSPDVKM